MKLARILSVAMLLLLVPGCIYFDVVEPLDTDVMDTTFGAKVGQADAYQVLGLVAWGDRGTKAAADAAGIKTVRHMDIRTFAILGIVYTNWTTIVYGD
ncbi:MAG: hypothetical protein H6825_13035 [Planctomycetes bacterium]|nr:hypothetical protein [Planctomycetota bacterium]